MEPLPQPRELGSVEFQLPSGERVTLFHGDLIGRIWSAALRLDDARVSEAHAMVSNRGREMKLLALRGRFMLDGKTKTDVALAVGMRLLLAPGLELQVTGLTVPQQVLRVAAENLAPRTVAGVLSLYGAPEPRIRSGWRPDAHGYLWPTGEGWMRSGAPPIPVFGGSRWTVHGAEFSTTVDEGPSGTAPTQPGGAAMPLTLIARYDTVHIQRAGSPLLHITGRSARLISELAVLGQPSAWHELAELLWGPLPREQLRSRWDMQLQRLRRKLRAASVRADLVSATGNGLVELLVGPHDVIVDET